MLTSEGGGVTPGRTEKHSPCACPSSWYGSCPSKSTLTSSYGVSSSAANTSSSGGKTCPFLRSSATKRASSAKYGFDTSSSSTGCHEAGKGGSAPPPDPDADPRFAAGAAAFAA